MQTISFQYWTNIRECMGCNVGNDMTIELSDEEAKLFREAVENSDPNDYERYGYVPDEKEYMDEMFRSTYGMLFYFRKALPEPLGEKIYDAISMDFQRNDIRNCLYDVAGEEFFKRIYREENITEEDWQELDEEMQVDLAMQYGEVEWDAYPWEVVEIKILE